MNLSRTAIRYELSSGSAAVLLRLCLRIQLLWILIWAASDLFFVWYWSGRLSGPRRPRILRAMDSRLVLHPEGPALLPITPIWRRSCDDREHVSLSELALLSGALVRTVLRLLQPLGSGTGDHNSRRSRISPPPQSRGPFRGEASARPHIGPAAPARPRTRHTELRSERAGVELAQVRIPRSTECEHFLITGATGAGKSMAIRSLLRQIQARRARDRGRS